jgi:hypothetical protein
MISEFLVYLQLGFDHITDIKGYDHILFVAALSAAYRPNEWKKLLWLVTAFTVGHSLTLGLATLDLIRVSSSIVETLIPVTIVATSLMNLVGSAGVRTGDDKGMDQGRRLWWGKYSIAAVFGLVHGMGFSSFLRAALGDEESIVFPLFAFNVGLELGQLLIVLAVLLGSMAVVKIARCREVLWTRVLSGVIALAGVLMVIGRISGSS